MPLPTDRLPSHFHLCGCSTSNRHLPEYHGENVLPQLQHILPKSLSADYREKGIHPDDEEIERSLSRIEYPIVLYLHGNSFDRTIAHRVELYNLLNKLDCHVVTFDYRGYGDSDGDPSEPGLVNDSRVVYDYVKSHCKDNAIIVWGHSMGSGLCGGCLKAWFKEFSYSRYVM
ncbi:hypothetical protein OSTOST_06330 [Ostertagia ostertagi]